MPLPRTQSHESCQECGHTIPSIGSYSASYSNTNELTLISNANNANEIFRKFVRITAFAQIVLSGLLLFGAFTTIYRTQFILTVYPIKSLSNGTLFLMMGAFTGIFMGITTIFTKWKWRTLSIIIAKNFQTNAYIIFLFHHRNYSNFHNRGFVCIVVNCSLRPSTGTFDKNTSIW